MRIFFLERKARSWENRRKRDLWAAIRVSVLEARQVEETAAMTRLLSPA
jgi:hypothetical protein